MNSNVLILCVIGVLILILFIIAEKFKNSAQNPPEDAETNKISTGYEKHSTSDRLEGKKYDFIPTDGSRVYRNDGNTSRRYKPNKNKTKILNKRKEQYETLLKKRITDLNEFAREMKISNMEVVDDFKKYKKQSIFLDVKIDIVQNKVIYASQDFGSYGDVFYVEEKEQEDAIKQEESTMIIYKCPHCNTDNIIGRKDKEFTCYYCTKKVKRD